MKKNVASQYAPSMTVVSAADGSGITSGVTVYVTIDDGSQTAGSGAATHKGNGEWSYAPTQAETNGDKLAFKYQHASAVGGGPTATVYTTFPQTGDGFTRMGAPAGASLSADIADLPTVAEFEARTLVAADYFDASTDTVTVGTNNDKTGYSLTQTFPSNFASLVITAGGVVSSNVTHFGGTAGTFASGIPSVNTSAFSGMASTTLTVYNNNILAVDTVVDAILEDTGTTLPATLATIQGATFDTSTDSLEAIRNRGDAAWTTATGFSTLTASQVNAEVVDALATDTYSEPTSVPAATSSLKDKIGYLFAKARNKRTQDATTETIFRDDGSTTLATSAKSDDGTTFTKAEDT